MHAEVDLDPQGTSDMTRAHPPTAADHSCVTLYSRVPSTVLYVCPAQPKLSDVIGSDPKEDEAVR